jgi:hypothetical protein
MNIALDQVRRTGGDLGSEAVSSGRGSRSRLVNEQKRAGDNVAVPFSRRRFSVRLVIAKSQHQRSVWLMIVASRQLNAWIERIGLATVLRNHAGGVSNQVGSAVFYLLWLRAEWSGLAAALLFSAAPDRSRRSWR